MKAKTSFKRCISKVGYANQEDAEAQCAKRREQYNDPTLETYLCNFGGHYHLGHANKDAPLVPGERQQFVNYFPPTPQSVIKGKETMQ